MYSIPIAIVGLKHSVKSEKKKNENLSFDQSKNPTVSIIVPVKNEEKVISRLLNALLSLHYPSSKMEIVVVNDESADKTGEICDEFAKCYPQVKVFNRPKSTTKAAALNFGVRHSAGTFIATFDADSVPEPDALLKAVKYFEDPNVAAVQGRICSVNANENMLTKLLYYEGIVQYEGYIRGKDSLNLFVGLAGTCQFIRRSVLEEISCWNEKNLSEDVELSLRLTENDYSIKYASDVRTWEESPNSIKSLVKQRARWYRGNIEMGLKFGKLLKKLTLRRFDAEMTLFGTYLILLCIVCYFMAVWTFFLPPAFMLVLIMRVTSFFTLAILALAGIALVCVTKPLRLSNLLWLPFIYAYWGFQSFIALYTIFQILLRRPGKWSKTIRSGIVTDESAKKILTMN